MCIAVFNVSRFVYFAREDHCVPRLQFYRRPYLNFVYCTTVWRKLLLFDDNCIANAEEMFFFTVCNIKKIVRDLLLFIGDDCIAMPLKNFPDVDTINMCVDVVWSFDRFDDWHGFNILLVMIASPWQL